MKLTYGLQDIPTIATKILETINSKNILFHGEMGMGKTTLIKEIIKQLGVTDTVSSPTYSIVNEYKTDKNDTVYHFDFYRINSDEEALDFGLEEYFFNQAWCLMEWPNKVENLLPLDAAQIYITADNDSQRTIEIK
ncbi:MAG: tRNA (adenosine(37)-N6)-threonylcarbamoyltransferase complex ATPase subunit type 1 TsaE [Flavobacteriaceae bacterium]|nr:MAG: tRNA (adenosine(37)-N6)-threonylcarbamoyltransferase complex ATPase subunit type 1 TsaE [Flavobacteriaceae bacterium]